MNEITNSDVARNIIAWMYQEKMIPDDIKFPLDMLTKDDDTLAWLWSIIIMICSCDHGVAILIPAGMIDIKTGFSKQQLFEIATGQALKERKNNAN